MKFTTKDITFNAIIAVLYVALTLISYPISFLGIQFRIAEILILLCFFNPKYTIGLTLGCILVNFASPMSYFDAIFGGIATLLSCLLVSFSKHLLIAIIFPILINSFIVGSELYFVLQQPFWINVGFVALGEVTVLLVGYIFIMIFKRRKTFYKIINAKRNIDFKF